MDPREPVITTRESAKLGLLTCQKIPERQEAHQVGQQLGRQRNQSSCRRRTRSFDPRAGRVPISRSARAWSGGCGRQDEGDSASVAAEIDLAGAAERSERHVRVPYEDKVAGSCWIGKAKRRRTPGRGRLRPI